MKVSPNGISKGCEDDCSMSRRSVLGVAAASVFAISHPAFSDYKVVKPAVLAKQMVRNVLNPPFALVSWSDEYL